MFEDRRSLPSLCEVKDAPDGSSHMRGSRLPDDFFSSTVATLRAHHPEWGPEEALNVARKEYVSSQIRSILDGFWASPTREQIEQAFDILITELL